MPTFHLAASRAEIEKGRVLFATFCARCHGAELVSGGSVPDLRYATAGTHEKFEEIVRGGALREAGMPSFSEDVTTAQVRLIQAYVLDRARQSAQIETTSR
jgi:mono/diheme cytochrome c family protein